MLRYEPRHPHDWLLLLLALACALLATLFVLFGAEVMDGRLLEPDRAVREWTMSGRHPVLLRIFEGITHLGDKGPMTIIYVAIGWRLFPGRRWWIPLLVLCAFTAATFVDWLKETYQVTRPGTGLRLSGSHSFPSGHASGAAAISMFAAYVSARNRVHAWPFVLGAVVITVLVGLSRMYLDRHWASDVAGGWVVGAALGGAFCFVYEYVLRHQRKA